MIHQRQYIDASTDCIVATLVYVYVWYAHIHTYAHTYIRTKIAILMHNYDTLSYMAFNNHY